MASSDRRSLGVARTPIPTDAAGNPIIYDPSGRPAFSTSEVSPLEQQAFTGREPGPGLPLQPYIPRGAGPRQWVTPSGSNLNYVPRRDFPDLTPFQTLRNLADTSDIVRLAIEDVIQQVVALEWDVHPCDCEKGVAGKTKSKRLAPNIARVKKFLKYPDREHSFKTWLTMLLEDCLVIDALTFYRQRTIVGEPLALVPIDGSTIKPIVDFYGRSPQPPLTAYQQVAYGRVETEFTRPWLNREELLAAIAAAGEDPLLRPVELIYAPKKPRNFTPYGMSPVERVIITINLALRRQLHYLAYYTDGNIPEAFWKCPMNWEPNHIEDMQDKFEKMLAGESGLRRRLRFMPGGEGSGLENPRGDDEWKKEFDEYLARVVCYAFNTSPLPLVQLMNRATGEMADAEESNSGHHPLMEYVSQVLTREIQEFLGEPELEFIWTEDKERDERLFVDKAVQFVKTGIYTIDDVLAEEGKEATGIPRFIDTASGPMFFDDLVGPTGDETTGATNPLDLPLPPAAGGGSAMGGPSKTPPSGANGAAARAALDVPLPPAAEGKLFSRMMGADLRRWRKISLKRLKGLGGPKREFKSEHIPAPLKLALSEWLEHATDREDVEWAFRSLVKARRPLVSVRRRVRLERKLRKDSNAHFATVKDDVAKLVARPYGNAQENFKGMSSFDVERWIKADDVGPTDEAIDAAMQWDVYVDAVQPTIHQAFLEGETLAAGESGAEIAFGLTDEQAAEYAAERGAELVGKRVLPDGTVVDNPNARWSISKSVRERLRATVKKAFDEGWTEKKLQETIESPRFWTWRSDMIARTEVALALNNGTAQTYKGAGVETVTLVDGPGCLLDGHDDDVAGVNGQVVSVDTFEEFPIGHPNCRRDAIPNQETE